MPYGTIKVDTITFTAGGVDTNVSISGLVQNPTFSGNITTTGNITGANVIGTTTVSGATVTGTTGNFAGTITAATVVGTTTVSGATVTGNAGSFTTLTGGVTTITSGVFATGTQALPSISFTSDPNTGIYSPGADQVAISTNGNGRLFVDASGNVGVGTSSPTNVGNYNTVHLAGRNASTGGLYRSTSSDNSIIGLFFTDTNGLFSGTDTNHPYRFATNGSERMRLDSSGRLGLGTSSPGSLLQVGTGALSSNNVAAFLGGSTTFENTTTGSGPSITFNNDTDTGILNPSANTIGINTGGNRAITISDAQRVGIGTTSPDGNLTIGGLTNTAGQSVDAINVNRTDGVRLFGVKWDVSSNEVRFSGNTKNYVFRNGSSEAETARIDSSGRLLVGTSSSTGSGELLRVEKASTGTEGAGIRLAGTYTIANDGTQTISVGNGCLVFVSENTTGDGALFFCCYRSATVTLISDPNNRYANSVTAGRISLTKSANSTTATVTNKGGSSYGFTIGKINCSD